MRMLSWNLNTCLILSAVLAWGQGETDPHPGLPEVTVANQFGSVNSSWLPSKYIRDDVRGEIVNFETIMVQPILVTFKRDFVVVANEADNRLVVLNPNLGLVAEVPVGQGICAMAERLTPGAVSTSPFKAAGRAIAQPINLTKSTDELWVTLRHQSSVVVVNMKNWTVTHLLRPPIDATLAGTRFADTPGGITFNANGTKAYVAASSTDHLIVYDAVNKTHLTNIPLKSMHHNRDTHMNEPLAVVRKGNRVYVTSYRSGNNTLSANNLFSGLPLPTWVMQDLSTYPIGSLPDFDVIEVSTASDQVTGVFKGVGTVLNNVLALSDRNALVVSNTDAQSGQFIGEGSFAGGRVAINQLSFIDLDTDAVTPMATEDLGSLGEVHIVQPSAMTLDHLDRIYVAGYGSANIGVFDTNGGYLRVMLADSGPFGLAFDSGRKRMYCYNRAANTVSYYNVSRGHSATQLRSKQSPGGPHLRFGQKRSPGVPRPRQLWRRHGLLRLVSPAQPERRQRLGPLGVSR